jgi:hypothetical protein
VTDQDPVTGKFVAGNKASPGRKPKERELRYYDILMSTVTFEVWAEIVKKAAEQAKKGDQAARKWLADYLVGPPVNRTELTGADGGTIRVTYTGEDDASTD